MLNTLLENLDTLTEAIRLELLKKLSTLKGIELDTTDVVMVDSFTDELYSICDAWERICKENRDESDLSFYDLVGSSRKEVYTFVGLAENLLDDSDSIEVENVNLFIDYIIEAIERKSHSSITYDW